MYTASDVKTRNGYLFIKSNSNFRNLNHSNSRNLNHSNTEISVVENNIIEDQYFQKRRSIKIKPQQRFFSRIKYFDSLPKQSFNQPCINISSPYIGSEIKKIRQQDLENKKNWISSENFKTLGEPEQAKFSDIYYVNADPSEPQHTFQFRIENKQTFLHGCFKI